MSEQRSHVYKWFIELDDGNIEQWLRAQALAAYGQALRLDPRYPGAAGAKAAMRQLGGESAVATP